MYNEVTAMVLGAEEQVDQLDGLKPRRSDGHVLCTIFCLPLSLAFWVSTENWTVWAGESTRKE